MVTIAPVASRDHLFISYRRDDARGASGRLYDWLRIGFGRQRVFRDVHSIGIGKWREKIDAALARSGACIAVIGPRWASADNLRRLHDDNDMVRHELVTALTDDAIILVPTLVEGADIPSTGALPPIVRQLFDAWNARHVTEDGWEGDIRRLISELAEATGLPVGPDLDTVLRNAGAAQQRVTELEQERDLQTDQIRALRRSLDDLTTKLAEAPPKERPHIAAAFSALAKGDTLAAEDSFEREFEARRQSREEESCAMAEAARNVANLALLRDVKKAASFYRKALVVAPQDYECWRLLGYALILLGDLKGAAEAMNDSLGAAVTHADNWGEMAAQVGIGDVARLRENLQPALDAFTEAQRLTVGMLEIDPANTEWQRDLSVSHDRIGDVLVAQGDGPAALAAYRKGLDIAEALAARDPANTQWQRDLSVSHDRIGDVLVAQGDGPAALAAYRKGLDIREALAARDPANTQWQRDLSVSHNKIGDVLVAQGDGPAALATYRKGLDIREALAARDPANTQWQRDLSFSHDRIGDVLVAQGDGPAALAAYRKGLDIAEALAARDPANTEWQRDLSFSHSKIGDVLVAQGDGPEALAAYRKGLDIAEALAARDPANTQWQRDLSVSHNKIGNVLVAQGDGPAALATYRKGLDIREALAARDPANTQWQRDLSVSHNKIGDVLVAQGDGPEALAAYRKGLDIREALAARDPANTQWQRDLSVSHDKIGDVLVAQGDGPEALATYRKGLDIREALAARDPANTEWQRDLSVSHGKIGDVLVAQGDGPEALAAYRKGLDIAEALAARDPANTQWQTDVAVSCAKLGALEAMLDLEKRRGYLQRGLEILRQLKSQGRLMPNQDWIGWFEEQLAGLTETR